MPTCLNCSRHFPNWMRIENKVRNLQRRKYCLDCSPFGDHNTRPLNNEAQRARHTKEHRPPVNCSHCGRVYVYDHRKGHKRAMCNSCHVNGRRFEVKRRAIEYKGGKCESCG